MVLLQSFLMIMIMFLSMVDCAIAMLIYLEIRSKERKDELKKAFYVSSCVIFSLFVILLMTYGSY